MNPSESIENLAFDYHTIRLMIGLIALLFPWVVSIRALQISDSISWSYHTNARDIFVGFLFVIGAFLISYKGHKPTLHKDDVSKFWNWINKLWKGAINFRIWERKIEEDLVGWVGGIAAWITALCPTSRLINDSSYDLLSTFHNIGAVVLFSATVYFCLIAFRRQVKTKIKKEEELFGKGGDGPKKLRKRFYSFCGWGIAAIMLGLVVVKSIRFDTINNITFWAESVALELFGVAWLIASQYLPVFTDESERQKFF